eukprot:7858277-Alexandrium_andersonii.AAC.1
MYARPLVAHLQSPGGAPAGCVWRKSPGQPHSADTDPACGGEVLEVAWVSLSVRFAGSRP